MEVGAHLGGNFAWHRSTNGSLKGGEGEAEVKSALGTLSKVQAYAFILISGLILSICPKLIYLWVGESWSEDEALKSLGLTVDQAVVFSSLLICLQLLALLPRMIFRQLRELYLDLGKCVHTSSMCGLHL